MPRDNYVSRRALELFRNHGHTLDDAIVIAGNEYAEKLRQRGILEGEEKPGRLWMPARGKLTGAERNG